MALYPESSLPHWQHSCLDLHLQRPKKIHEDEDVEELYTKVSICTSDCDVQCSLLMEAITLLKPIFILVLILTFLSQLLLTILSFLIFVIILT